MPSFMDRLKASYNILANKTEEPLPDYTRQMVSNAPSISRIRYDSSMSVLAPILTRIAIDAAAVSIRHVLVDEFDQYVETKRSELNDRLTIMANIDQSGTAFIQDAVMTMLQEGACALVPIEVSANPRTGTFDILSMRVATINQWYNYSVEVSVYNELTGMRVDKILDKGFVAICYNPLYAVMNEPNSTLRRLIDKLALLDTADARTYSNQLDLVLQLPFTLKNDRMADEANRRLTLIEEQLYQRKYGIAYIDANEKLTQLNRPVTNTLFESIEGLSASLHSQLGLTPSIFSGTASQDELVLYNNRTVLPVVKALTDGMIGAFFSRTAIRQGNSIMAFPSLFKMAPLEIFADAADKLTRNEIMTSNEVRAVVGLRASDEPDADTLRNKNLNKEAGNIPAAPSEQGGEASSDLERMLTTPTQEQTV